LYVCSEGQHVPTRELVSRAGAPAAEDNRRRYREPVGKGKGFGKDFGKGFNKGFGHDKGFGPGKGFGGWPKGKEPWPRVRRTTWFDGGGLYGDGARLCMPSGDPS
jgi:hypothetical protein